MKSGIEHVDKIAEQYEEYLRLRNKHAPDASVIPLHEMIVPDGGWYKWLYQWTH